MFASQSEFIEHIRTLTPKTDFKQLLIEEFGVDVPEQAPKYQQEYLYKYLLQEKFKGTPQEDLVKVAAENVSRLINIFPHILTKYDAVDSSSGSVSKPRKEKAPLYEKVEFDPKVHVIKFNPENQKYEIVISGRMIRSQYLSTVIREMKRQFGCIYKE